VTAVVHTNDFVDPAEVDTSPVLTDEVPVVWPRSATTSRYQGVVIMRALVNADGLAEEVSVLRCDHEGYGISQAAVAAALKYRFRPGEKNGVKIKTYATVTKRYNFVR
jgi:TonB family protein